MPKILIVDDEEHIRFLLEQTLEVLEDEGVELFLAENGEVALELIRAELPEMVLLDVMVPKINGFDVCNMVKRELVMKEIYVILLTAKGQESDKQRGKEVAADLYLTKPFHPGKLLEKVREVLEISS